MRSRLLNLLKRQLVYILFDGEISSGYDGLACMPDAKKGRMIKAILKRLRHLPHKRIVQLCILRESAVAAIGFSVSLFRLCTITYTRGEGTAIYGLYRYVCRCEGYGFQAVYSSIGYTNQSVWV